MPAKKQTTAAKAHLSSSLEDYLEAILRLEAINRVARTKDLADMLGVNMSSVTGALKVLVGKDYVDHTPYSFVTLTPKGKEIAEEIFRRHVSLARFLERVLGIEAELADENACRMEHAIGPKVLKKLVNFTRFVEECPIGVKGIIEGFQYYCKHGRVRPDCSMSVEMCRNNAKPVKKKKDAR